MILHQGDKGLAVVLLKYRMDRLRNWVVAHVSANGFWGPSTVNNQYDYVQFLNVAALQSVANRNRAAGTKAIKVDGIYGPETEWIISTAEHQYGIA